MKPSLRLAVLLVPFALVAAPRARAQAAAVSPPMPAPAGTAAEPYRVGAGDELEIQIHSGAEGSVPVVLKFPVAGDGKIAVMGAGQISVAGLTASEIQERIRRQLIASGYYKNPFVAVNVTDYLSQCVNVTGAVKKQGRFCLKGPTRLLDILSMAEGVDEENSGRTVVINRQGAAEPIRIDRRELYAADSTRSQAANVRVLAGDNIYIPVKSRMCISGPVENAGCFAFDEGATLHEAMALAGGLKQDFADRTNITIRRHGGVDLKVNLDQIEESGATPPLLEPDDQIIVGEVQKLRFCVNGQVGKPDCVDYVRGLTIEGALSKVGGTLPIKADRNHVVVRRLVDGKQQDFTIDMDKPGTQGAGFIIQGDDQIVVPALDCYVTVDGGVKEAGNVDFKTGMMLTDAFAAAKGYQGQDGWPLGKLEKTILRRGSETRVINAKAIITGREPDIPLQCGDKITVPTRATGSPK